MFRVSKEGQLKCVQAAQGGNIPLDSIKELAAAEFGMVTFNKNEIVEFWENTQNHRSSSFAGLIRMAETSIRIYDLPDTLLLRNSTQS